MRLIQQLKQENHFKKWIRDVHFVFSDFLLIVGGWTGRVSNTVEVVSPSSHTLPSCLRNLSNFPVEVDGAVGTVIGECKR